MKRLVVLQETSWLFILFISLSTTSERERNDIDDTPRQSADVSDWLYVTRLWCLVLFKGESQTNISTVYVKMVVVYLLLRTFAYYSLHIDLNSLDCDDLFETSHALLSSPDWCFKTYCCYRLPIVTDNQLQWFLKISQKNKCVCHSFYIYSSDISRMKAYVHQTGLSI